MAAAKEASGCMSEADQRRKAESAPDEKKKARGVAEAQPVASAAARDKAERAPLPQIASTSLISTGGRSPRSIKSDSRALPRRFAQLGMEVLEPSAPRRPVDLAGKRPVHDHHSVQQGRPTPGGLRANLDRGVRMWDVAGKKPLCEINLSKDRRDFTCEPSVPTARRRPGAKFRRGDIVASRHRHAGAAFS